MTGSVKKLKLLLGGILLIGLIGAGLCLYFICPETLAEKETFENPRIAVFPFTSISPNSENDYLSAAFSDEIFKNLSAVSSKVQVTKGRPINPGDDLKQLLTKYHDKNSIDLALLGTYIVSANEIEISARLVETQNAQTLYEKTFTVPNKDISLVPREISGEILRHLRLNISSEARNYLKPQQIDENVYRDYLKVYDLTDHNRLKEAVSILESVVEREPQFYYAWTTLARHYDTLAGQESDTENAYFEKAVAAANKAKGIDPNNPEAGILTAQFYADQGDLEAALKEYKALAANDLDPAGKLRIGAYICRYGGLLDESVSLSQSAFKFTPKSSYFQPEIYYRGDYEAYKKATTPVYDEPGWYSFTLGMVAIYQNDKVMIRKRFQEVTVYEGETISGKIGQAILLHLDGKTSEGLKILHEQENIIRNNKHFDGEILFYLVAAFAYLGDKESSIRTFRQTVDNGFFCYPYFLNAPVLDKLRSDVRFQQILETSRQKHLKFKEIYYSDNQ